MIKTQRAGKRVLVVGLLVAAIACGNAVAAAIPAFWVKLHARLAPVSGTAAAGWFTGTLLVAVGGPGRPEPSDNLPQPNRSVLTWKLSLPALRGPISASLRTRGTQSAPPVTSILCARCSTVVSGSLNLTVAQGLRIVRPGAVIVVRTASATLRGRVEASPQIVAQ